MGVRSTTTRLLASSALIGPIRVSTAKLLAASALQGPLRVSSTYLLVAQSFERGFYPTRLESDGSLDLVDGFGISSFTVTLAAQQTPEYNPYKPIVSDVLEDKVGPDGYAFLQENQETLRAQHNLIQAGDTTFPYQLLITSHAIQHYTLGAVGRFYHETYGVIEARYVQFSDMVVVDTPQCPVGLFRNRDGLKWIVTNDYAKSDPDLVVGISAPWTLPTNSHYGWVIVDGPILQQVKNNSDSFSLGEAFTWDASGSVSNIASGKIIGRRVNKTDITRLTPGSMWVRTESFSETQINEIITAATKSLLDELHALERQLLTLPNATTFQTLQRTVTALRTALNNEVSTRIAADLRLNERISNLNFVTLAQLNNAINLAVTGLSADITNLANTVTFIRDNLGTLSARVDGLMSLETTLQAQIDSILSLLSGLALQTKNKFPVVDGSVPPNLVYTDDGSLVYTEE